MPKIMKLLTVFSFAAAVLTTILFHCFDRNICLTLAVTFGTITYHLGIRLLTGLLYNARMKNRADYTRKWHQPLSWENKLYQLLKVKTWKNRMPVYSPEVFSVKNHTWDEIAQATCQSELVHETNMLLSFIPLTASLYFGAFYVFLITSICGAIFDLLFVIIQRYNRPRIVKIALRQNDEIFPHLPF